MIITLFDSPIVVLQGFNVEDLFPKKLQEEILHNLINSTEISNDHSFVRGGKACTANLMSLIDDKNHKHIDDLLSTLRNIGIKYAYVYKQKVIDLKTHSITINLSHYGSEVCTHQDKRIGENQRSLRMLFYPKMPFAGGRLVFMHENKTGEWVTDQKEKDLVQFHVEEGDIILFDNYIPHAVGPHLSDLSRISIHVEFDFVTES